jgi:formylglycine-generating enzyme required for sulfatase activity
MNLPGKSMLSFFFLYMLLLVCSSLAVARERVALVIGNAAYQSQSLTNPVNDAKAVAKVLRLLHFDVTLVTDVNQEQMETAILDFGKKLRKDKEAVFYYSGHGVQYQGENYLIPVDAISRIEVPGHLRSRAIELGYILELMVEKGSGMNIVLLDACRSNPFKSIFLSREKGLGMEKGLATLSRRADGMLISYATSPGDIALDGTGRNSPYTTRLVELMMIPDLPVEMMFNKLRSMVSSDTASKQIPWIAVSLEGFFYFNPVQVNDDRSVLASSGAGNENSVIPDVSTSVGSAAVVGASEMLGGKFVHIPAGEFTMGSPADEVGHQSDETQHQVKVSDFYMGKYEVSVVEFRQFIEDSGYRTDAEKGDGSYVWDGSNYTKRAGVNWRYGVSGSVRLPSEENHPVIHVSWNDAVAYCKWMTKETGKTCRLPSEAEREYACRAGSRTPFNTGANLTTDQANYAGNYPYNNNAKGEYRQTTVSVDSFPPNAWGLYNMHGNVYEWCSDWYGGTYYDKCKANGTVTNPAGPVTGSRRVIRGGSWDFSAEYCRSAYRLNNTPVNRDSNVGFRLVFLP